MHRYLKMRDMPKEILRTMGKRLKMLTTEDTAAANAWLRRYVRVMVRDNQVSEVRFNFW